METKGIEQLPNSAPRGSLGETRAQNAAHSGRIDPDLAKLNEAWPTLSQKKRNAIIKIMGES